ncbi:MAG: wax ester/triacylglycerol synthase family O-acyltransferase [Halioglobus sp.]
MEQLSGLDSMMVLGEISNVPLHMSALFIYDPSTSESGTIKYPQLTSLLHGVINSSLPMLKCRAEKVAFTLDKPYWVEDQNFNLDYHIQRFALPQPANWAELNELIARFHAQPLHPDRPLWQSLFIEGLDNLGDLPSGCVGMVMKIHHALADGKTAVKIFSELHTLSPEPTAALIAEGMDDELPDFSSPSAIDKYSRAYWHLVSSPAKLLLNIGSIAQKMLFSSNKPNAPSSTIPDTPFNQLPSADRNLGHIRLPMNDIRQLEEISDCTINDIAMCIIAGGLRSYLESRQQLPDQSLVTGMPINIRSEKDKKTIGNHVSLANLSLFTEIADPKKRLQAISKASTQSRQNNQRTGPGSLLSVADNLQPGIIIWAGEKMMASGLVDKLPRLNNTIISNVPGIMAPCYLAGAKLVDYLGLGPLAPTVSLFHAISSIHSHISICFQSCSSSLEDPDAYTQALEKSYRQLKKAYGISQRKKS